MFLDVLNPLFKKSLRTIMILKEFCLTTVTSHTMTFLLILDQYIVVLHQATVQAMAIA